MINTKFKQTEIGEIPETWEVKSLDKIAIFQNGKSSPERNDQFNTPVFGSNGVIGFTDKSNANEGTAVVGRVGSYCGSVYFSEKPCWVTDNAIKAQVKDNNNPKYLFYLLRFLNLNERKTGSGQPLINQEILNSIETLIPSASQQNTIASILSSLDDKIELNQKTIKTLEETGQTLFKRWFIDFEFPNEKEEPYKSNGGEMVDSELGEIPKGWIKGILEDIAKINTKSIKPFNFQDDIFIHYSIPSFDDTHAPKLENGSEIKSNKTLVNENSLLVSKLNPLGWTRIWTVFYKKGIEQITSTEFINYIPKDEIYWSYLNFLFREKVYYLNFCSKTTGSTGSRQRVLPKSTLDTSIAIPTVEVLENYSRITNSVLEQIEVIHNQIQELKSIRDSLLPKLLSGKIRV